MSMNEVIVYEKERFSMESSLIQNTDFDFASVVDKLCAPEFGPDLLKKLSTTHRQLPSRNTIMDIMEKVRLVLFPGYFGHSELSAKSIRYHVGSSLDHIHRELREQVRRGFCFECGHFGIGCPECEERAEKITLGFLRALPQVQSRLAWDIQAAYDGDPAATSRDEVLFCYPGVHAVTYYRIAHLLHELKVPIIPRIITEQAHSMTGIDIHPGARIGDYFFIDHGTGVVIGETCVIGDRVRIYQGVTLGAKSFPLDIHGKPVKGIDRHPVVGDDVIIYSGATILGNIKIGRGSVIGGNVWITRDVPEGSIISQRTAKHEKFEHGSGI
jgi:serine O-acetyltransferase